MAYAGIEPFGEEAADLRTGIIASVIANVNRDRKRKPEPFTPLDFMPFAERPVAPSTPTVVRPVNADLLSAQIKALFGTPMKKKG